MEETVSRRCFAVFVLLFKQWEPCALEDIQSFLGRFWDEVTSVHCSSPFVRVPEQVTKLADLKL